MEEREQIDRAIAAQEQLRGVVADEIVDSTIELLRARLDTLSGSTRPKRRRHITVLFADLAGSTSLADSIDPEEFGDRLDEIWECLDPIIDRFDGRIDKHIGDAVMALWGVDSTNEDDPEQAVRAALEMHVAFAALAQDGRFAELALRIGINTGPVVLSPIASTEEFTAIGDTVNTAARLEGAAAPGGVLVGHGTYRHVRGVFSVRDQPPLRVKGKPEPLRTYSVEGVEPRPFRLPNRGVEGVETRMVGRHSELERVQAALGDVVARSIAATVSIFGEAGIGKSRLLFEFEDWLRLLPIDVRLFKGRADLRHEQVPYALIRDLLFFRFEIAEEDPGPVVMEKLGSGIEQLVGHALDDEVKTFAHLLGVEVAADGIDTDEIVDPQRFVADAASAVGRLLAESSRAMPVVLLLEDLHWADPWSLRVITSATGYVDRDRVMVVGLARPNGRFVDWGRDGVDDVRIELTELTSDDAATLVGELLQHVPTIPVALSAEIVATADGNPFFLEELVKMMIDDGVIVPADDSWHVRQDLLGKRLVPPTITGVIQARLDRLPSRELTVLQGASVIGRVFWDQAIPIASGRNDSAAIDVADSLAALEARELVFRRGATDFDGCNEFVFKHAILHEVTYDTVLRNERRAHHRHVAEWLTGRPEGSVPPRIIAGHYEAGGAELESARWFAVAAHRSFEQYAYDDAVTSCRRALRDGVLDPAAALDVSDVLCQCLTLSARYDEGCEAALAMHHIASADGYAAGQVRALMHLSESLGRLGLSVEALDAGQRARRLLTDHDSDPDLDIEVLTEVGWLQLRLGRTDEALDAGREASSLADTTTKVRLRRGLQSLLGATFSALGGHSHAERHFVAALSLDRQRGHSRSVAGDLLNLGELARLRGDFGVAVGYYDDSLAVLREIGDRDQQALALSNLGGALLGKGDLDSAAGHLLDAIDALETSGGGEHLSETHRFLAEVHLARGDLDAAAGSAGTAMALALADRSLDHLGHAWRVFGLLADAGGRPPHVVGCDEVVDASGCLDRSAAVFTRAGMQRDLALVQLELAGVVADLGDDQRARALRRQARDALAQLDLLDLVDRFNSGGASEPEP